MIVPESSFLPFVYLEVCTFFQHTVLIKRFLCSVLSEEFDDLDIYKSMHSTRFN